MFKGVAKPASPINPITGPSAAVPSCLCPLVTSNAVTNALYSPLNKFYKGINLKFFEKKVKIIKKNIFLKDLINFEEIILIGSGKSVTSVKTINQIRWKRRRLKVYSKLKNIFETEAKKKKYYY